MKIAVKSFLVLSLLALCGCQGLYYKTMETFGHPKRELLVSRVEDTRNTQQEVKEQFQTALQKFSAVVNFNSGELGEKYNELEKELEKSESKANDLHKHIRGVEDVSNALFKEWESELNQYTSDSLREKSRKKLEQTRQLSVQLINVMKQSETRIEPVLSAFRDQVLFLKHNLNARAVSSLQDELISVRSDIAVLVDEMETSITEADAFIKAMGEE